MKLLLRKPFTYAVNCQVDALYSVIANESCLVRAASCKESSNCIIHRIIHSNLFLFSSVSLHGNVSSRSNKRKVGFCCAFNFGQQRSRTLVHWKYHFNSNERQHEKCVKEKYEWFRELNIPNLIWINPLKTYSSWKRTSRLKEKKRNKFEKITFDRVCVKIYRDRNLVAYWVQLKQELLWMETNRTKMLISVRCGLFASLFATSISPYQ